MCTQTATLSPEERHKLCSVAKVFLVGWVCPPLLLSIGFQHGDSTDVDEQVGEEERGDHADVLPPRQDGRGRKVEPAPHENLTKIVWVTTNAPQPITDELSLRKMKNN